MTDQFEEYAQRLLHGPVSDIEAAAEAMSKNVQHFAEADVIGDIVYRSAALAKLSKVLKANAEAMLMNILVSTGKQQDELTGKEFKISFEREDRKSWDQDALRKEFQQSGVPPYVTQTFGISKTAFEALDPATQTVLDKFRRVTSEKLTYGIERLGS